MVGILAEKIHDNRFLRLIGTCCKPGTWRTGIWNATLSGAPQGGVVSPVLSNIYLHRLDKFVETVLHPGIHPRETAGHATRTTRRLSTGDRRARAAR